MTKAPVIRVVKKVRAQEVHHGGSWKVAYADFVTAMMAFFLVMWIISMSQKVREEIQSYFRDPLSTTTSPAGISKLAAGGRSPISNSVGGLTSQVSMENLARQEQRGKFRHVQEQLTEKIATQPDLSMLKHHVKVSLNASGLEVDLMEATDSLFFQSGSAELSSPARKLLAIVAPELGRLPNPIVIEGHTDAVPYRGSAEYTNWELSADRANAARRAMQSAGLQPHQVAEVRGYADSKLRDPERPTDYTNRRVSIMVGFLDRPAASETKPVDPNGSTKDKAPFALNIKPAEWKNAERPL